VTQRLTFRTRLTLAYTAIVAIAVVLVGTIGFVTVRFALESAFQTRLETTVKAIRSIIDVRHGRLEDLHGEDLVQFQALLGQGLNAAVLRSDGSLMSSNLPGPPVGLLDSLVATSVPDRPVRTDAGTTAYVTLPISEHGVRFGTIVTWESRSVYDSAERTTLLALGGAGAFLILAAGATGSTLARRMLRPVTEMSAMMSAIEATDLGERLAWNGPDDELGRLCMTFDRLLDRLETAFERERRFVADASHELRTPLSVMRAEVELALMHDRESEDYRAALHRLQRETRRLEHLAQSLILTARDEDKPLPATPVALDAVVARAAEGMQPLAQSRKLALHTEGLTGADVAGDDEMLERAVIALIDNALRFARTAVVVRVTVDEEGARIAVSDDGRGFSEDALLEATSRFWRDDPTAAGTGTGLGLAIARSIVERHHGSIALHNVPHGTGAVVVLTLPIYFANSGVIASTEASPA
jgi:two-component system OmpR family sensor kinase